MTPDIRRAPGRSFATVDVRLVESVQRRVLWLATRMIDHANRGRPSDEVKVGGHQASSASAVSVMSALYLAHLDRGDRVAVKPHASPVLHALNYLLGDLDGRYLTSLREAGGLQPYPSRTKDPDRVDFSTGSVGLGAAAPLFAAVARRYVDSHFGPRPRSRFVALIGDAELDEGNVWEAVSDPATGGLGNVMWVVDFNRQSLDRVVPGIRIDQWRGQFSSAGWHVVEVKYGRRLRDLFDRSGGSALRRWVDAMPNEQYQSLFGLGAEEMRARLLDGAPPDAAAFMAGLDDDELSIVTDLGGHDIAALLDAFAECDSIVDRPSVVFAYTVKGWGLPLAGNPRNHSALLSAEQIDRMRVELGLSVEDEWSRFGDSSPEGELCRARGARLRLDRPGRTAEVQVPVATGVVGTRTSTQDAFGRILTELSRDESVRRLLVTTAPDVATSTNLAGFINRTGVYNPEATRAWSSDPALRWAEGPTGQHIELGISEMNLFLLLGQLGLAWDLSEQPLLALGTVYDPFVLRGLDAFVHATYSGSRFVVAGTPSGVTLAPEGGAHQSTITASVGMELPGRDLHRTDLRRCPGLAAVRCAGLHRARRRGVRRPGAGGAHGLLLPTHDEAAGPGTVCCPEGSARRCGSAPTRSRRLLPTPRRRHRLSGPRRAAPRRPPGAVGHRRGERPGDHRSPRSVGRAGRRGGGGPRR